MISILIFSDVFLIFTPSTSIYSATYGAHFFIFAKSHPTTHSKDRTPATILISLDWLIISDCIKCVPIFFFYWIYKYTKRFLFYK